MLIRTTLLPSVFTFPPGDTASVYGMVIGLLQILEKTGVILVDDEQCISDAFSQRFNRWPESSNKFKKKAQVLLKELDKKNRIVSVRLQGQVSSDCGDRSCQYCIRIAKDYLPIAVLARQACNPCVQNQLVHLSTVRVIDVDEYTIDDAFCSRLTPRDHVFDHGEGKQHKFEQEILVPLFRDAKHVKIYDRYIGRSILQKNADNYKLALEWILEVFVRESRKPGVFEIYSGFYTQPHPNQPPADVPGAKVALRQLETDMRKIYPNFKLIIKNENRCHQLPHDRYLVTNQVAVSIGRGFDLLLDKRSSLYPRRMRDVHINYCSESGKIEQAFRRLPNLYT